MIVWTKMLGLLVVLSLAWVDDLPEHFRPDVDEPLVDAIQIWRLGADYVPDDVAAVKGPFAGLDRGTYWFLKNPYIMSAVQFSCSVSGGRPEWRLIGALDSDRPPEVRLLALVILVRLHAPRSIAAQWKTLNDLKDLEGHPGLPWMRKQLHAQFAPASINKLLKRSPPKDRYDNDPALEWAARAAGVTGYKKAIPRLTELSVSDNLDASLAAVVSLAEIPGEEAERGLVTCLKGWQYDAYVRAGRALRKRNPKLLEKTLLAIKAPEGCRYWQGVFLGRLGNPAAVPILCAWVGRRQRIDREMFDLIKKLAQAEHLELIEKLPDTVRPNQRKRALEVRAAVRKRLG